jgi:hypothetical protein
MERENLDGDAKGTLRESRHFAIGSPAHGSYRLHLASWLSSHSSSAISIAGDGMAKFRNILETIGNTPVVRINRLAPPGVNLFVKIEAFNPLGSVKDRLALGVIEVRGAKIVAGV